MAPNLKICDIVCAAKRQKWQTYRVSRPPYDGAPYIINEERVGHFKTKNLANRVKLKKMFLREDICPLFKPKKQGKKSNAMISSFLFFQVNVKSNVFPFKT